MTSWLKIVVVCIGLGVSLGDDKMDYLTPYKFVKPLEDLGDLYGSTEDKVEEDQPVAEARTGEAAPLDSTLMSSSMSAPDPIVKTESGTADSKSRSRKKGAETDAKDRMSNHKTEERMESRSVPMRSRLPPRPEDEYYYYYDDEYYYDDYYPDYHRPPVRKHEKYPNFPVRQKESKPFKGTQIRQDDPKPKETKEHKDKQYNHKNVDHKNQRHKKPYDKKSKPMDSHRRVKDERKDYNIQSTINRLKGLRENQVQRAGKPSLPNPWEKFNLPPKSKPEPRPKPEEKKIKTRPKKVPPQDYYNDYYYDYTPVQPIRRSGGGGGGGANPLALLVAPLAGIALLTAAAAVAINPVLVTVSLTGKRRKRGAENLDEDMEEGISPEMEEKIHEMQVLEKFMASIPDNMQYQHQVLSMYLSCSGYTEVGNTCIDRVVCEYADTSSIISSEERDVISIVLYNIMSNEFVTAEYKDRLRLAAKHGRDEGKCLVYECAELADMTGNSL